MKEDYSLEAQKKRVLEMRKELQGIVDGILHGANKKELSLEEIQQRVNLYLKTLLDKDDRELQETPLPQVSFIGPDGIEHKEDF